MTTKEQERKALEQIRKIVSGLGENSYIAAAFEGCFEIAEENINNDFACSMKQRADAAEEKAARMERYADDCKVTAESLRTDLDNAQIAITELNAELREAKSKQLTPRLYKAIWESAYDKEELSRKYMLGSADFMAQFADSPQDIAFKEAVKSYKRSKANAEAANWIMNQIEKIKPEGC